MAVFTPSIPRPDAPKCHPSGNEDRAQSSRKKVRFVDYSSSDEDDDLPPLPGIISKRKTIADAVVTDDDDIEETDAVESDNDDRSIRASPQQRETSEGSSDRHIHPVTPASADGVYDVFAAYEARFGKFGEQNPSAGPYQKISGRGNSLAKKLEKTQSYSMEGTSPQTKTNSDAQRRSSHKRQLPVAAEKLVPQTKKPRTMWATAGGKRSGWWVIKDFVSVKAEDGMLAFNALWEMTEVPLKDIRGKEALDRCQELVVEAFGQEVWDKHVVTTAEGRRWIATKSLEGKTDV